MTPADLKIRREALGLPQAFVAEQLSVQDRAVRRWEAGDSPIPQAVDDLLSAVESTTEDRLDAALDAMDSAITDQGRVPEDVRLAAYSDDASLWTAHPTFAPLPASWHRMMLARLRDEIGVPVSFHFASGGRE